MPKFDEYIFITPSFLRGAGHALDLSGCLWRESYMWSSTSEEADRRALASDWRVVGRDLNRAMAEVASTIPAAE